MLTQETPVYDVSQMVGQWWIVRTRSNLERRLQKELSLFGHFSWLPIEQYHRLETDNQTGRMKRRKAERVKIPGYLFLCGDGEAYDRAARSTCRLSIIPINDQARFVRELANLQKALDVDPALPFKPGVAAGRIVNVIAGPFFGLQGIVEDLRPAKLVVQVGITILGRYVSAEIPADQVEPLYDN